MVASFRVKSEYKIKVGIIDSKAVVKIEGSMHGLAKQNYLLLRADS